MYILKWANLRKFSGRVSNFRHGTVVLPSEKPLRSKCLIIYLKKSESNGFEIFYFKEIESGIILDRVTTERRSWIMSRVKSKNTTPEITVRKLLHRLGYRYRLHDSKLPGKPDLVFRSRFKAIFVHGCFWHGHKNCSKACIPKTRQDFWHEKMQKNAKRDEENEKALARLGWKYLVIWQCQIKDVNDLKKRLIAFLDNN